MAELCPISQTVEKIVKKPRISCTNSVDPTSNSNSVDPISNSNSVDPTSNSKSVDPTPNSNSVDPTSRLPDHVLHSIFSCLRSENLFHVRLVSKNCYRNTPSCFALCFDESTFFDKTPTTPAAVIQESHNKFLDSICSSLEISQSELNKAEKRVLRIQFEHHENIYDILRLMNENDFHEVYLRIGYFYYWIPFIFQSSCLTVLHLNECGIDEDLFRGEVKFASLQDVELDRVNLTGETLSKFISKCPNIRELRLVNCKLLKSVVLPKLDHLEKLYVKLLDSHPSITDVLIIALGLQVFHFVQYTGSSVAVNMDIRACRMLREFHLDCDALPVGLDHEDFCSDFPHLETLLLGPCVTSKRVRISSPTLRRLTLLFTRLYNPNYSRKSVVSVPNLCSFYYVGRTFKSYLAPSDAPKFLKATCIALDPQIEVVNRAWFLQLRSHLTKISYRIGLALVICDQTNFSELRKRGHKLWSKPIGPTPTQVLPCIEHIKLDIRLKVAQESHGCLVKYMIDNLLWMSLPNALILSVPASFSAFALEICNQLFKSKREGNCCADTQNKCWRHLLKDFVVREVVAYNEGAKLFLFKFTWQ